MIKFLFVVACLFVPYISRAQTELYHETYRPQFHFSPASGWIGDPDGLIKYKGLYHLFWWGHATSEDLVYWQEQPYPMQGGDGSFDYYTGSVVVDVENTSGFGTGENPPMVAVYTANNRSNGIQDQRLSYSTDYQTFQYYSGNPVLTINSKDFRDPDVFWDSVSSRWIMSITLPIERKIDFYASDDLKSWEYLSSFGPVGAREQVWEVPQLLQLPIDGDMANRRWVLVCSMGPNKIQYFIGHWDGTTFVQDPADKAYLFHGEGLPGDIFQAFETGFGQWTVEGTAFGTAPASGALPDQMAVSGYLSEHLANSYHQGDASTGKLSSPSFIIEKNNINFLIGGGDHAGQTAINLIVNDAVVKTASGNNSENLKWKGWNVTEYKGQEARIEIIDAHTGSWGHITVDHILFSDVLMNTEREHANWIDWGADFYAARAYTDYDEGHQAPVKWLGWMGNWEYANQVPTSWGRGAESIAREIGLRNTPSGLKFFQEPIPALEKLRGNLTEVASVNVDQTYKLNEFSIPRNTYELEASFVLENENQHFGMNLFAGSSGKLILGYDAASATIYLDRRYAGNSSFSAQFPKIMYAPLEGEHAEIKFHVFVDQSSIEVFVNDGAVVLTSLVFPYEGSTGIELFSWNGTIQVQDLRLWPLQSIWGVESPVTGLKKNRLEDSALRIFPNPVTSNEEIYLRNNSLAGKPSSITIFDLQGRVMYYNEKAMAANGEIKIQPNLPPGLYCLKVAGADFNSTSKILVK